jgi:hypothetical protein
MQREKGLLMARDGEQPALRRRSRDVTGGSHDPYAPRYGRPMSQADTSPHTDGYRFDEGMIDPPRSSSIRLTNTQTQPPRYPGSQQTSSRVPPRRNVDMTKDLPPQMRQSGHTGRQPRLPTMQPQSPANYAPRTTRTTTRNVPRPVSMVKEQPRHRVHWLLPAGVGMVAMLVLWVLGTMALSWGIQEYNQITYGMPRTYQTDAVVGHGGDSAAHPSHFIAMNLQHQAVIYEIMASNPSKSITYVVNIGASDPNDLAPVTLRFKDLNGDHKLDMIVDVHVSGGDQLTVFINTGTKFRPQNANDKLTVPIN